MFVCCSSKNDWSPPCGVCEVPTTNSKAKKSPRCHILQLFIITSYGSKWSSGSTWLWALGNWFECFVMIFFPGCYWLSDQILIQKLSSSDLWWTFKHQRRFKLNPVQKSHFFLLIQGISEVKFAFLRLISTVFSKIWFWFVFSQILCWEFLMQKNLRRIK